jgi:signal transduction histidine kinase
MTILVVDDHEENRYQLQVLLTGNKYEVITAVNGADALEKARQNPPDIIISDILMPMMDGFTLCREWKKDERLRSIPFIFYTATYTEERDREFALSLGAEKFFVKPTEPEVLMAAIQEVLGLAQRRLKEPGRDRAETPSGDEVVYLKQYNEVLIQKLEHKMAQLEQTNRELDERVKQRTSELSIAAKQLEAFSYSVAHDLKAPLRAIAGFSDILEEDYAPKLDENGKRVIGVIKENTEKMGRLIDDLLKLSYLGRQAMNFVDLDMTALAHAVSAELKEALFRERLIEVIVKPLPSARAAATRGTQSLTNLISNAMKFTAGQKKALIEIGGYDKEGERIYYIKDNGAGFDMKYAKKLFEPFERLHTTEEFGGTGIGLAIVSSAVQRHGGRVWTEAAVGQGATFYFTLPRGG